MTDPLPHVQMRLGHARVILLVVGGGVSQLRSVLRLRGVASGSRSPLRSAAEEFNEMPLLRKRDEQARAARPP